MNVTYFFKDPTPKFPCFLIRNNKGNMPHLVGMIIYATNESRGTIIAPVDCYNFGEIIDITRMEYWDTFEGEIRIFT